MSELIDKEVEIRAAAAKCDTLQELSRKLNWPMTSVIEANRLHKLGLDVVRKRAKTGPREKRECPKPISKSKGEGK